MKILCFCDSPTLTSGFARVAQNLLRRWAAAGAEIHVWGIGWQGWRYRLCPYVTQFLPGGTGMMPDHWASHERMALFLGQLQVEAYTHVWILQDTFMLSQWGFPKELRKICTEKGMRSMLYFPVDAPLNPEWTDIIAAVDVAVAYTYYGATEAKLKMADRWEQIQKHNADCEEAKKPERRFDAGGLNYNNPVEVMPHGVDMEVYRPIQDRAMQRAKFWHKPFAAPTDFLLVNVNVNQRRKDTGRSLELLARLREMEVPAKLVMHMRNSSDDGLMLTEIGRQLGLKLNEDWTHHDQAFQNGPAMGSFSEDAMRTLYNIADLYLTTSLGEGWGLGITEALACGTPVAMPDHTSCTEIAAAFNRNGMGNQVVLMPVEEGRLTLGNDNSRMRPRVDLAAAAETIHHYYKSGLHGQRPGLTDGIREWLSWDRIAREMLGLLSGNGRYGKVPVPDGGTPGAGPCKIGSDGVEEEQRRDATPKREATARADGWKPFSPHH